MQTREDVLDALRQAFPALKKKYGVRRIGIFGSYAKGLQSEESDIDVIVGLGDPIGFKFFTRLLNLVL